jgi:cobalt-zinc-cadmium resistance protein CzcA
MKPLGLSGNLMSLGALDFGIIVDGTVIVLDNCVRFIQMRYKELGRKLTADELKHAVYEATVEIRTAAGFGELIVIMVFLPVFALTGVEGKMFTPMAATFILAVFAALIFSFTTAPALASLFLSTKAQDKEPRLMLFFRKIYIPFFELAYRFKKLTIALGAFSVIVGVLLFKTRGATTAFEHTEARVIP